MELWKNEGQEKAQKLLNNYDIFLFQADWIGKINNNYVCFEIKDKEPFKPPPFLGQGINKYQIQKRLNFYQDTSIRTFLLCFWKDEIFGQWLDVLDGKEKYTTKNNIVIYPLKNFIQGEVSIINELKKIKGGKR